MNKHKKQSAFTLVELIVVITILAILGTISFITLQGYSIQARDSTRISDIGAMKTSLELYNLDSGKYPIPTEGTIITYSGATAWTQGYFGETVYANLEKLDKIPTDPLTSKQYVYSTTNTRNEFELAGIMEGDEITMNNEQGIMNNIGVSQTNASEKTARVKISGTYNGTLLKLSTGSIDYVLAVPSLITSSGTDLQVISTNNLLAYNGYKNLPFQYSSTYKTNGETNINLVNSSNMILFSGNIATLSDTTSIGQTARVNLLTKLQNAYSGTTLKNIGEITQILNTNTTDTKATEQLITTIIRNNLGGKIIASGGGAATITYSNCESGTQDGYNYASIIHNQSEAVTKTGSLSNGILNYGADVLCTNGTISIQNEITNIACNSSYVEQVGTCVLDVCGNTVPNNAHSTAISQTVSQNWTQNTTPGICTFECDTNYTWNGSSCTANTQSIACTGLANNAVWNTVNNITQTWSGTNWLPTESGDYNTTSSTTECRYICDSNYTWNGSSCEADTQNANCGGSIPTNSTASTAITYTQTWNGSAWSPTTSWGESQATCDFNCNSGYNWNGSNCVEIIGCSTTQPTNATLTTGTPTIPNQAWQNTNSSNPCYYTCSSGYGWNGSSCVLIPQCTTGLTEVTLPNGQTWSCMNLGATTVWDGTTPPTNCFASPTNCNSGITWIGNYYQWGKNDTVWVNYQSAVPYSYGWEAQNDTKWGGNTSDTSTSDGAGTTAVGRKGPCPVGWHVPSAKDWQSACNNILSTTCTNGMTYNSLIITKLRLPLAGYRGWSNADYTYQSVRAAYWSSSPSGIFGVHMYFNTTTIMSPTNNNYRANGYSVRCIKN